MGKEYLDRLAPCGLHCGKCFAFAGGDINRHSAELKKNLGNFRPYAERFSVQLDEVFEVYPQFEKMLNYFSDAECGGCKREVQILQKLQSAGVLRGKTSRILLRVQ